jgi:hypothetical protein
MLNNLQLANLCVETYKKQGSPSKAVEFYYHNDRDQHIFAIRGPEVDVFYSGRGLIDTIRNLPFWPKPFGEKAGHAAVVGLWHKIYQPICEFIALDPDKPVVFTGHGIGGIIALIGAYELIKEGLTVSKVITFGAPRGLDLGYPDPCGIFKKLEHITEQFEHPKDPVPGYASWSRYKHVNTIFLDGQYREWWFNQKMLFHWMGSYRNWLIAREV